MIIALLLVLQGPPGTDIYLAPLTLERGRIHAGNPTNATHRPGYDNQPFFAPAGNALLYTAIVDGQADIFRYDLVAGTSTRLTTTPESEYSPTPLPDCSGFSVVRVEADSTQRLWRFDWTGAHPKLVLTDIKPVGYHAWGGRYSVALFVLGTPPTLQLADTRTGKATQTAADIGRGLQRIPGRGAVSFVQRAPDSVWTLTELDVATGRTRPLVQTLRGVDQYVWTPDGSVLMARGAKLFQWKEGRETAWQEVADFSAQGITNVTRLAVSPRGDRLALVAADPTP